MMFLNLPPIKIKHESAKYSGIFYIPSSKIDIRVLQNIHQRVSQPHLIIKYKMDKFKYSKTMVDRVSGRVIY